MLRDLKLNVFLEVTALTLTLFGMGCASLWSVASDRPFLKEEFDPQTLDDDDIVIRPNISSRMPDTTSFALPETPDISDTTHAQKDYEEKLGYRVQIFASLSRERALEVMKEASEKFDVGVYVEFDPPFYKVRIGDCRTRKEAERLVVEAEEKGYTVEGGYTAPFWVETEIRVEKKERIKVQGFRVQVFANESRDEAEKARQEASEKFDVGVYVEFDPPFYKVRIGDCRTADEAESLLREVRAKGYEDAFRVRTEIWVEGLEGME